MAMELWIWLLAGLAAGFVFVVLLSLAAFRRSKAKLKQRDAEVISQLAELDARAVGLQQELNEAEAKAASERALLEEEYHQKLVTLQESYRENLAMLESKFADLNASLFGQPTDDYIANLADLEEEKEEEPNSPQQDYENENLDTVIDLAALTAIAENELLVESFAADEGFAKSIERSVAEEAAREAELSEVDSNSRLENATHSLDTAEVSPLALIDAELENGQINADIISEIDEVSAEEASFTRAIDAAVADEALSLEKKKRLSSPKKVSLAAGTARGAAGPLDIDGEFVESDAARRAVTPPKTADFVEEFFEKRGKVSEGGKLDWLEGAEDKLDAAENAEDPQTDLVNNGTEPESVPFASEWPEDKSTWQAQFFNNLNLEGDPILTREDTEIDFDWGLGSPAHEIDSDGFSARWQRTANLPPGLYRFTVISDDGVRLWIDGRMRISAWYDHTELKIERDIRLPGSPVDIQLDYYDNGSLALISLSWRRIG